MQSLVDVAGFTGLAKSAQCATDPAEFSKALTLLQRVRDLRRDNLARWMVIVGVRAPRV